MDQADDQQHKHTPNYGCGCALLILILILLWVIFTNTFTLSTIYHFGFGQYFDNIVSFHVDSTQKITNEQTVYEKIPTSKAELASAATDTLLDHTYILVRGDIDQEYARWLAVSYYKGKTKKYGYILDDSLHTRNQSIDYEDTRSALRNHFLSLWKSQGEITYTEDRLTMQMMQNSTSDTIIHADEAYLYYCAKDEAAHYIKQLEEITAQAEFVLYQNGHLVIDGNPLRGADLHY